MLKTNSLKFGYNREKTFSFPDLDLNRGDECLLLGGSGCGKTTLLHLVGGLLKSESGLININGSETSSMSEKDLDQFRGKHIGFIFQRNHLIPALSIMENLLMPHYLSGRKQDVEKVYSILDRLDLRNYAEARTRDLSYGQAQRVAIARAIMNEPYVILADEPTSALDDDNCARVIALLREVKKINQSILIIATHDQRLKSTVKKQIGMGA